MKKKEREKKIGELRQWKIHIGGQIISEGAFLFIQMKILTSVNR